VILSAQAKEEESTMKRFIQVAGALAAIAMATAVQAAGNDSLTGLPLYPDMESAGAPASQDVCGTPVTSSTYSPRHGDLATLDGWYKQRLHGFTMNHGVNRNYPYDIFTNADGTKSVTILGSGPKTGVEGVVYHKNPKPSSMINLSNWLTGANALCK
jgi:hypothetical protein